MKFRFWSVLLLIGFFISSCSTTKKATTDIHQLHFLGEYDVPFNKSFENTTIGGLSGIDYDKNKGIYYLISDDRSTINPARFYTAKVFINEKGIDSVLFLTVANMLQPNGTIYPNSKKDPAHTPDPECIRYNQDKNELVWSSEGERIVKHNATPVLEDPSIDIISTDGHYRDSFALPDNMHMHATENGPRQNGVFEGMSYADNYKTLYVSVEEPIYEDGPRSGLNDSIGWIRIIKYDVATRKPVAQYAYQIDPVAYPPANPGDFKINGVPDILSIGKNKLMVIERSFSTGRLACTIKVYIADLTKATDVSKISSLRGIEKYTPASKQLLLNMNTLGIYVDNIEGVTFGPDLPNGHKTLVFVADNNFMPLEKTQFFLFEVN